MFKPYDTKIEATGHTFAPLLLPLTLALMTALSATQLIEGIHKVSSKKRFVDHTVRNKAKVTGKDVANATLKNAGMLCLLTLITFVSPLLSLITLITRTTATICNAISNAAKNQKDTNTTRPSMA